MPKYRPFSTELRRGKMGTTDTRDGLYFPPTWSLLLAVLAGGGPFSIALIRIGIDMESPELIRYVLISSPLLCILMVAIAVCWASIPAERVVMQSVWCSLAMWVPLEALTYVVVSWELRRWNVFSLNNLPFLLLLLVCCSLVFALISAAFAMAIRTAIAFGKKPHRSG